MDFTVSSCSSRDRAAAALIASRLARRWKGPKDENPATAPPGGVAGRVSASGVLLAQAEALDQRAVDLDVGALEVVEQAAALAHQPEQATAVSLLARWYWETMRALSAVVTAMGVNSPTL